MGSRRFDGFPNYRWPLLLFVCRGDDVPVLMAVGSSPTPNPGNIAAKALAKIHGGAMHGQLCDGGPQLELVTVAVAAMAIIAVDRHVHRQRATMPRPALRQRTTSVPLRPRPIRGPEAKQVQDLLHGNLGANSIEVDARHGCPSLTDGPAFRPSTVPFPFSLWGTGTTLLN
jgi:hypothetical protein